jgi:hypothetical protein
MKFDPAPRTGEIITTTDTRPGEAEPRLTLSQLQALLNAAAAYERAQRPVVLHGPQTAPTLAPATHPGIGVHVPGPASTVAAVSTARHGERSVWPLVFMASAVVGIGSCLVAATTGALIPVAVTLAAFGLWGTATYQLVFVQDWK